MAGTCVVGRRSTWFPTGLLAGLAIAVTLGTSGLWQGWAADLGAAPKSRDRQVTGMVMTLIKRDHLSKHPIDDEISQRGLKSFLKTLDPGKLYFMQSDIDEFQQRRSELDDLLRTGDISFGYTVFNRYLQRLGERLPVIDELID